MVNKILGIGLEGAEAEVNSTISQSIRSVTNHIPTIDVLNKFQPIQTLDHQRQAKGNFDQAITNASFFDKIGEARASQEPAFNIHDRLRFSTTLPQRVLANLIMKNGLPSQNKERVKK